MGTFPFTSVTVRSIILKSGVAQAESDTTHAASNGRVVWNSGLYRQTSPNNSAPFAARSDLEDTRCPARLATRPLFSASSALLSWKPRLALTRLSQAGCALGCWLVPATGSAFSTTDVSTASSLHAAVGSHGLADLLALSAYAALCVCLVWLAHWHGERRYIAGKADYHAQLASMATGKAVSK